MRISQHHQLPSERGILAREAYQARHWFEPLVNTIQLASQDLLPSPFIWPNWHCANSHMMPVPYRTSRAPSRLSSRLSSRPAPPPSHEADNSSPYNPITLPYSAENSSYPSSRGDVKNKISAFEQASENYRNAREAYAYSCSQQASTVQYKNQLHKQSEDGYISPGTDTASVHSYLSSALDRHTAQADSDKAQLDSASATMQSASDSLRSADPYAWKDTLNSLGQRGLPFTVFTDPEPKSQLDYYHVVPGEHLGPLDGLFLALDRYKWSQSTLKGHGSTERPTARRGRRILDLQRKMQEATEDLNSAAMRAREVDERLPALAYCFHAADEASEARGRAEDEARGKSALGSCGSERRGMGSWSMSTAISV